MLRDRLVCGVNHPRIQKRRLQENFRFDDAMKIARAMETAERNSEKIGGSSLTASLQKSDDVVHRTQG